MQQRFRKLPTSGDWIMRIIAIGLCLLLVANLFLVLIPSHHVRTNFHKPAYKPKQAASDVTVPLDVIHHLAAPAFRHRGPVYCMAATNDGRQLLTGSGEGVILWEVATGKRLRTFDNSHTTWLALAGDRLAYGAMHTAPRVKDFATGNLTADIQDRATIKALALAPDGNTLASVANHEIRLWDTNTCKLAGALTGHTDKVQDVVFAPDSRSLYSISFDNTLREWDLGSGAEQRRLALNPEWCLTSLALSQDGNVLAIVSPVQFGDRNQIRLLGTANLEERFKTVFALGKVEQTALSFDGRYLAAVMSRGQAEDGHLRLWETSTGNQIRLDLGNTFGASCVCFLADGKTLASAGYDGVVHLWNVEDGVEHPISNGPAGPVDVLKFSPSGDLLASATSDGTVRVWDTVKGLQLHVFRDHVMPKVAMRGYVRANCCSLQFSPDGHFVFSTGIGFGMAPANMHPPELWDVQTGKLVRVFESVADDRVALAADGRTLAAADNFDNVRLWEVATGRELRRLAVAGGHCAATFSPDGRLLATVGDKIRLWHVATGTCLKTIEVNGRLFPPVWFSPDGSLLFAALETIDVFDTATRQQLLALDYSSRNWHCGIQGIRQTRAGALTIALAPRSYGSPTPGVSKFRTFDLATGKNLGGDIEYGNDFAVAQFSPDGRQLALGFKDGRLLLCKPPPLPSPRPVPATITRGRLNQLWHALAGNDAKTAYEARWLLSANPQQTLPMLRDKLRPIPAPDVAKPSNGEVLRTLRAVCILETIGTDEALAILNKLSSGAPGSGVTEAAKAAVGRFK